VQEQEDCGNKNAPQHGRIPGFGLGLTLQTGVSREEYGRICDSRTTAPPNSTETER
jgi:hypothetical protein